VKSAKLTPKMGDKIKSKSRNFKFILTFLLK